MANRENHAADEFAVMDDDENEYDLIEWQELIERRYPDKPSTWEKAGPTWFRLADGSPVNRIDNDTFEVAANGKVLKRVR